MSKKKKSQFNHYKKWTTDEGYSFVAESKEDAIDYLKHIGHTNLGKLKEVKKWKINVFTVIRILFIIEKNILISE